MKFRCERDVLTEAVTTAGRAAASRGGALPVLSGVRAELAGDRLTLTGSDLDLTISVSVTVNGETDGVAVVPAKLASDIVRSLEPGAARAVAALACPDEAWRSGDPRAGALVGGEVVGRHPGAERPGDPSVTGRRFGVRTSRPGRSDPVVPAAGRAGPVRSGPATPATRCRRRWPSPSR